MNMKFLFDMLNNSTSPFHTVDNIRALLDEAGFTCLAENDKWQMKVGGKYYVVRNGSSIIAFYNRGFGFGICASHSDFPAFKVKCESADAVYARLAIERYGGMMYYSWLDRALSVSGRVAYSSCGDIKFTNIRLSKNVVIPSVAIHMNRSINESAKFNPAVDMLPLSGLASSDGLIAELAHVIGCRAEDIKGYDLYLASAEGAALFGMNNEFILSPRLDDIECVSASLEGFLCAEGETNMTPVFAVFDNEEIGSETKQGAESDFLYDVLRRISANEDEYLRRVASGFMISADNAHALHPNHPELSDKNFAPRLGGGVVIKNNASAKYATDAISSSVFSSLCELSDVPYQLYYNRADIPGGSTLGTISNTKVSLPTVDIGLPQLAMHSICESAAVSDYFDMVKVLRKFYNSSIFISENGIKIN